MEVTGSEVLPNKCLTAISFPEVRWDPSNIKECSILLTNIEMLIVGKPGPKAVMRGSAHISSSQSQIIPCIIVEKRRLPLTSLDY
jgi:hypothetical protein